MIITNNSTNNFLQNSSLTSGVYSEIFNISSFPARYNLNFLKNYGSANCSISSGTLVVPSLSPLNTQNIIAYPSFETSMENWKMTMEFSNPRSGTSETFIGITTKSTNSASSGTHRDVCATFDLSNGTTKGRLQIWTGAWDGLFTARANNDGNLMPVNVNDTIRLILNREGNVVTATAVNLTQSVTKTISFTYTTTSNAVEPLMPNVGQFGILQVNQVSVNVSSLKVETTIPYRCKALFVGDSKFCGYNSSFSNRVISRVNTAFAGSAYGLTGPSDTTNDLVKQLWLIKRIQPKVCIIEFGCNDIRYNISYATYTANLLRAYNELIAAGIKVIFTGAEETAINQAELFNFLLTNFPDNTYLATGLTLSGDGIHTTDSDNLIWYNGLLPLIQKYLN